MADLLAPSLASMVTRRVISTRKRIASFQAGTARQYLEYQALKRSLELFDPGAFVPWVSYLFPPEILASYDLTPLIPEVAATTLTGTDLRPEVEAGMQRLPLARDTCSYHRAALASLAEGLLPPPSICLGTTPLCLGKEVLLDSVAARHGVPFRSIRVPLPPDDGPADPVDIADVATQLEVLHEEIGRLTGRRPRMSETVRYSNRATAAWQSILDQRLSGELLLNGRQAFALTFIGQMLWGTEGAAKGFEKLLEPRGRRDLELAPPAKGALGPRIRLLWLHTVPHHDPTLFELMLSRDAAVVFEEMSSTHLEPIDPADPFRELARRLIEHPLWGSSSRRARLVLRLVERGRIDGVVHFTHWGCRHGAGSLPVLRTALGRAGVPLLAIDGDALDQPGTGNQHTVDQVESFLEML